MVYVSDDKRCQWGISIVYDHILHILILVICVQISTLTIGEFHTLDEYPVVFFLPCGKYLLPNTYVIPFWTYMCDMLHISRLAASLGVMVYFL